MQKSAVFLDFQGTIGRETLDDIRFLTFFPFSIEAIKLFNDHGILVIGITNQSHISKGELSWEAYDEHLNRLKKELAEHGAWFDQVYCCPHRDQDNCTCKKPLPGMVEMAKREFSIDIARSYVIGDMGMTDMALASRIGAKGILVLTGGGKGSLAEYRHTWAGIEASHIAENLLEAAKWIVYHDLDNQ